MGLYDRDYYQGSAAGRGAWQPSANRGPRSVVVTLIMINVAIFLIDAFTPGGQWLSIQMALKTDIWSRPWNVWQFVTYGFAHSSINSPVGAWHILGNMIALFFLGRHVEQRLGRGEFIRFYFIALVLAGLAWLLIRTLVGQPAMVVGASGAVAAVVLLFVFYYPREKIHLFGVLPIPAWLLGVLLVGMDLTNAFRPGSMVAAEAHLAGAAFAACYFYFRWNFSSLGALGTKLQNVRKPRLRLHDPEQQFDRLRAEADQILEKLHRDGEESLTKRERQTLERYSRSLRRRSP